jgi:hypothetical protein
MAYQTKEREKHMTIAYRITRAAIELIAVGMFCTFIIKLAGVI